MTKKPTVTVKCVAESHNDRDKGSRIVEFMDVETQKGGLLEIRRESDGTLTLYAYRLDEGVYINGPTRPEQEKGQA